MRSIPTIARLQVLPHGTAGCDRPFAIDKKKRKLPRLRISDGNAEQFEGVTAGFPSDNPWHAAFQSCGLKEGSPTLPKEDIEQIIVAATFGKDPRRYQRLPPSSPMLQRVPSECSFSHAFILVLSSLSKRDSPFSFSHTTTLDE